MRLAESRKRRGVVSFLGVTRPKAAREGRRLFLVTVALSPDSLAGGTSDGWHMKKEAFASFRGISVFSPSVYRTSAAGWGQGWRGSAGRRSS